jgi:hypothetical protein
MQRAGQRGLKVHAVTTHPVAASAAGANHQPGHGFVGLAAGDAQQILPVFFFRISLHQHVLRGIVHAAQIAGVL